MNNASESLDNLFSELFEKAPQKEAPRAKTAPTHINIPVNKKDAQNAQKHGNRTHDEEQSKELVIQIEKKAQELRTLKEVYDQYQENTAKAQTAQNKIFKGVASGEPIESLFLQAVECIARMTNDTVFYNQVKAKLIDVYGIGLNRKPVLEMGLKETEEAIANLEEALDLDEFKKEKANIRHALNENKKRKEKLQKMIKKI